MQLPLIAEVAASIRAGRIGADSSVPDYLSDPLPTVGIGKSVTDARTALGRDHPAAIVLRDGRAIAVITRSDIDATARLIVERSR